MGSVRGRGYKKSKRISPAQLRTLRRIADFTNTYGARPVAADVIEPASVVAWRTLESLSARWLIAVESGRIRVTRSGWDALRAAHGV